MFQPTEIKHIMENINKIKLDAAIEYKTNNEPTIEENVKIYKKLLEFIIENKRILYGGTSQNKLIKMKNSNDTFYTNYNDVNFNKDNFSIADIEFYSPTPEADVVKLCNIFKKLNYRFVEAKNGVHEDTYKIFINLTNYCDISYIPKIIADKLPTIMLNNVISMPLEFMMIDYFRILTDPLTSYWRLDKSLERFNKLFYYYPILEYKSNKDFDKLLESKVDNGEIMNFIMDNIIEKFECVIIGYYALHKLIDTKYIPFIDIILGRDYVISAKKIYEILINKYKDDITVREFFPFFQFHDARVQFYHKNIHILTVYRNNNKCITYNKNIKHKSFKFGNCNLVMMYFLISYYNGIIAKFKNNNILFYILQLLNHSRYNFFKKNNKTIFDNTVFKDFTTDCIGETCDTIRQSLINRMNGLNNFYYNPDQLERSRKSRSKKKNNDKIDISGNRIFNKKYLIF
jgi:hypothetical protein